MAGSHWLNKKSVLVSSDFDELSYDAIAPAKEFVETEAALTLIHVLAPLHPADPAAMWNTLDNEQRKQKVRVFLAPKLGELGYQEIKIKVAISDPSAEIIDYVAEKRIELNSEPIVGVKRYLRSLDFKEARLTHEIAMRSRQL